MHSHIQTYTVFGSPRWASAITRGDFSGMADAELASLRLWCSGLFPDVVLDFARDVEGRMLPPCWFLGVELQQYTAYRHVRPAA